MNHTMSLATVSKREKGLLINLLSRKFLRKVHTAEALFDIDKDIST
jgi:hypothetical protein